MEDSVFSKLDKQSDILSGLSDKVDGLSEKIDSITNKEKPKVQDEKQVIRDFIRRSDRFYLWLGTSIEFEKDKRVLMLSLMALVIMGIISSIVTSICLSIYSTFTLFENIVLYCGCWQMAHTMKAKWKYSTMTLSKNSIYVYMLDGDGVWRDTNKEKKRYKVFRILGYIAVVGNIICIWIWPNAGHQIIATILEVLFLASVIVARVLYSNFFCLYHIVAFDGTNQFNGAKVTLIYDNFSNILLPKEEYEKKFPFLK